MAERRGGEMCSGCGHVTTPVSKEPLHHRHLLLAALTLGLWLPVWWYVTKRGHRICPHCTHPMGRTWLSQVVLYVLGAIHVVYFLVISVMYVVVILSMP